MSPGAAAGTRRPRARMVREGLLAGLVLGLADMLATGPWRAPLGLFAVVLGAGLLGGLVAGLLTMPMRRAGGAAACALAGAAALAGISDVSKLHGGAPALALACLVLALAAGAAALAAGRRGRGAAPALAALVAVPAGSLLATLVAPAVGSTPALLLGASLPLAVLGVGVVLAPRTLALATAFGAALLPLPVLLLDRAPPPHEQPPPGDATPADGAPDVLLIVIDTLRADAVDWAVGNGTTPTLAALAARGVRFEQAIASAPWTLPSMASLLTGLLPSQHGAVDRSLALPQEATTLAERLGDAGYRTAAFTGGAFVDPGYGLAQGFEHFDPRAEYVFRPLRLHVPLAWRVVKNRFLPQRWVLGWVHEYGGIAHLHRALHGWLEGGPRDERPLFLLLHTYQVHDYYLYHPVPDDAVRARLGGPPAEVGRRLTVHPEELFQLGPEALAWFEALYHARLEVVDRELGRLLDTLAARRTDRGLVLALTSDHGEGFDALRHRVHHGGRLHDDLLRVPLVLLDVPASAADASRLEPGRVVAEQVRQVDVVPTLLELAGAEPLDAPAGTSLLPALAGSAAFPAAAWAEEHLAGPRWRALRAPPWKLMEGRAGPLRYDVRGDPAESEPLPFAGVPALERLWISFDERYPARMRASAHIDPSVRHQLDHIGYGD